MVKLVARDRSSRRVELLLDLPETLVDLLERSEKCEDDAVRLTKMMATTVTMATTVATNPTTRTLTQD